MTNNKHKMRSRRLFPQRMNQSFIDILKNETRYAIDLEMLKAIRNIYKLMDDKA